MDTGLTIVPGTVGPSGGLRRRVDGMDSSRLSGPKGSYTGFNKRTEVTHGKRTGYLSGVT